MERKGESWMKRYIKSSQYTDYNPADGWTEEDIELHKSIDWAARNFEDYPVDNDSYMGNVYLYTVDGRGITKNVEMVKYLRSNPIYPPYYAPRNKRPFEEGFYCKSYVGPSYDGVTHKGYQVYDRFEDYELYDYLSR